jgi:hypothetical protein
MIAATATTPRTTAHQGKVSPELLVLVDVAGVVVVAGFVAGGVVVVGGVVVDVVASVVDGAVDAGVVVVCAVAPDAWRRHV